MSLETDSKSNRIAICHMRSTNDTEKNRLQVAEIVQKAKERNANVSQQTFNIITTFTQCTVWCQLIFLVCLFTRML